MDEEEIDFSKLRYVEYDRKSSDDPQRQVRSIPDQNLECGQLAKRLNLKVVKVFQETKSAKQPNLRPLFKQMLKGLKDGEYDAILAWNPDRLARNMLEAGMIIDMVDTDVIKDLKFVTHHFTKDANGKMLLGMSFVLSKQYSDDLSQKVTRGVRRRHSEGLTPTPKHGYTNELGIYKPDGKNFDLICEAWQMRIKNEPLDKITEYLNKNDYSRTIKSTGRKVDMDSRILSDIFKDPFYYGILVQANQKVVLRQMYDFDPAITEEEYQMVQQLSYRRIKPSKPHRLTFYPFRLMVKCSYCSESMRVGPSTSGDKKHRYLNFRCDNKECTRKKKSIRSKVVLDFIYQFLEKGLNLTEEDYKDYYQNMTELTDENREKLNIELHSRQGLLRRVEGEIKDISLKVINIDPKSPIRKVNEDKVLELDGQKEQLENEITQLKTKVTNPEQDRLSIEEFLNLSKNASTIVQSADAIIKDTIVRQIFLNFTVDEEKVLSHQLKPHFEEMVKIHQQRTSRGPGN